MDFVLSTIAPIWKVLLIGLVLGAGMPAMFALGVRSLSAGTVAADGTPTGQGSSTAGKLGAAACFTVVLLAVGFGIAVLVGGKHFLGLFGWT